MSYEAKMIIDAICDDVCEICIVKEDGQIIEDFRERIENRIAAFESELVAQTKRIIVSAVNGAQV